MAEDLRTAHVVLTTANGDVLGRLAPLPVANPWWDEVASVVEGVKARDGLDIVVLRLLEADRPSRPGGNVTYLAEVEGAPSVEPWTGMLDDDPRRQDYARPGGPAAALAWAQAAMAANGISAAGPPEQVRTWNLSAIWRLPSDQGVLWLKVVPPFFAHEGRVIRLLSAHPTPRIVASEGGRLLMRVIPGEDLYDADAPTLLRLVELLVGIQVDCIARVGELLDLGVPDWRAAAAIPAIASVTEGAAAALSEREQALLGRFIAGLPDRFAALEACGLPSTLVHGDFHPGNCRGSGQELVLLDFGDTMVGHPLLDMPAFVTRVPVSGRQAVSAAWFAAWRRAIPDCDPERASELVAPIATARQAVIYQAFLDAIEPSEHVYHREDPQAWLKLTAKVLRAERRRNGGQLLD